MQQPAYAPLLADTVAAHRGLAHEEIVDRVLVRFGLEILKVVPGRVSTEVDARLSFDTAATVARARRLMALYEAAGIGRERVLIKIAATWEGIRAAEVLEREGRPSPAATRACGSSRPSSDASTTGTGRPPAAPGTKPQWPARTTPA